MLRKIISLFALFPILAWGASFTPESFYQQGVNYLNGNDSLGIYMKRDEVSN